MNTSKCTVPNFLLTTITALILCSSAPLLKASPNVPKRPKLQPRCLAPMLAATKQPAQETQNAEQQKLAFIQHMRQMMDQYIYSPENEVITALRQMQMNGADHSKLS